MSVSSTNLISPSFEKSLAKIFQWNPEWCYGRALIKPPVYEFKEMISQLKFKSSYTKPLEYVNRHSVFVECELFIKLMSTFKETRPTRVPSNVYIQEIANHNEHQLNRQINCFRTRTINMTLNNRQRICCGDICILTAKVRHLNDSLISKKYFGLVLSQHTVHPKEVNDEILHEMRVDPLSTDVVLDQFVIYTKRSRDSTIISGQMAMIEPIYNGNFELKQLEHMMRLLKETDVFGCVLSQKDTLTDNILNGDGTVYRWHKSTDQSTINKFIVSDHLFGKVMEVIHNSDTNGVSHNQHCGKLTKSRIMCIDVTPEPDRITILQKTVLKILLLYSDLKFLIVTKNDDIATWWKGVLKRAQLGVRVFQIDENYAWQNHNEIKRCAKKCILKALTACNMKIQRKHMNDRITECKKETLLSVIPTLFKTNIGSSLSQDAIIARMEFLEKGYKKFLTQTSVIIGTIDNIMRDSALSKVYSWHNEFDCCIIDEAHSLTEPSIIGLLHFGIKSLILAGDYNGYVQCENPSADDHRFDISLFKRIIINCNDKVHL